SNATAAPLAPSAIRSAAHWRQHALGPVLMWPSVAHVLSTKTLATPLSASSSSSDAARPVVLLEIGPSSVLSSMVKRGLPTLAVGPDSRPAVVVASMVKSKNSHRAMMEALGHVYAAGLDVRWDAVHEDTRR